MFVKLDSPGGNFVMVDPRRVVALTAVAKSSQFAPDAPPQVVKGIAALWLQGAPTPIIVEGEKSAIADGLKAAARVMKDDEAERKTESIALASKRAMEAINKRCTPSEMLETLAAQAARSLECGCPGCSAMRKALTGAGYRLPESFGLESGPLGADPFGGGPLGLEHE